MNWSEYPSIFISSLGATVLYFINIVIQELESSNKRRKKVGPPSFGVWII